MNTQRSGRPAYARCQECGASIPVRPVGSLPSRCAECRTRRVDSRSRHASRPVQVNCRNCGALVRVKPTGSLPTWCVSCARERRLVSRREHRAVLRSQTEARPSHVCCQGCGVLIPVSPVGRLPTICTACRPRRRAVLHNQKSRRPTGLKCQGCGIMFRANLRAKVASRCPDCRVDHKRSSDRSYGKENRERKNEANKRWRERNKRPPQLVSKTCVDCGLVYEKIHVAGRLSDRCPECRNRYRLARVRIQTAKRREQNPEYFTEYRRRNGEYLAAKAIKWAKENPEKHRARGSRYRSRKYSDAVELFTRKEIGDRDSWICAVCSCLIDPGVSFPDPLAGELDHVIPVTHPEYPGHIKENVAVVHSRCNKAKGGFRRVSMRPGSPTAAPGDVDGGPKGRPAG